MADETPKTVTVEADQPHTYNGTSYEPGDIYEIDVALLDSIQIQKKAHLVTSAAKATEHKPSEKNAVEKKKR